MNKNIFILFFSIFICNIIIAQADKLDLDYEYSLEYYQKGVRAFHNTQYEFAITNFLKALSYKEDNNMAR
ncbi:MAG TPA: hypothetical protein PK771_10335, partial [Spirochaetota bacterium]|nr:hypothetical protein [Spirochaetota bacterium]